MTPKNISDPGPGEVMTLEIFFDLDPSGVMTPEIFLNPTLAGSTAVLTAAGSNWGRPRMIPTREDPEFSLTISLIFARSSRSLGLTRRGQTPAKSFDPYSGVMTQTNIFGAQNIFLTPAPAG